MELMFRYSVDEEPRERLPPMNAHITEAATGIRDKLHDSYKILAAFDTLEARCN